MCKGEEQKGHSEGNEGGNAEFQGTDTSGGGISYLGQTGEHNGVEGIGNSRREGQIFSCKKGKLGEEERSAQVGLAENRQSIQPKRLKRLVELGKTLFAEGEGAHESAMNKVGRDQVLGRQFKRAEREEDTGVFDI